MKAIILVGGYGTRLRPLTLSTPKPLVEFINKPIVQHQIEALAKVGVTEVVLAINYRPEVMREALDAIAAEVGIKITCSQETEPMGTAGPLALAREHLEDGDEPFFVFNSDVTCEYPLAELVAFHKAHDGEATILVTKVEDPSKYGVVVHDDDGKIARFVEKPKVFVGDEINAGLYILSPSVLDRIPLKPTSIEREIFPAIASEGKLFCMSLPGFWMDIGQPPDYLTGARLYLEGKGSEPPAAASSASATIVEPCAIHPEAEVSPSATVGPYAVIGKGCKVGDGARVKASTLLPGAVVGAHSLVTDSLVGWHSRIGSWCRVESKTVLGEDVAVKDEVCLRGAIVLPHKGIKASIYEPGTIIL